MLDSFHKGIFRLKRYGEGLSENEKLLATMIPSPEIPEADLLRLLNDSYSESKILHAALAVQTETRIIDRSRSHIDTVQEEYLDRLYSIIWNQMGEKRTSDLYLALDYYGLDIEKKNRCYYIDCIVNRDRSKRRIRNLHVIMNGTVSTEQNLRILKNNGFKIVGKMLCDKCKAVGFRGEGYHVKTPSYIDPSDVSELNHIEDDEPMCLHNIEIKKGRIGFRSWKSDSVTWIG